VLEEKANTRYCIKKEEEMLCPYCLHEETKVVDKRDIEGKVKRRRECLKCVRRFNTREGVEMVELRVMKKDGKREDFDRDKMRRGIIRACEKRPVSEEQMDKIIYAIEERLRKMGKEVKSNIIGELVSRELKKLDKVAYIRFASVYREFADVSDFKLAIANLKSQESKIPKTTRSLKKEIKGFVK
jgi:transcriptional repressor NrdR